METILDSRLLLICRVLVVLLIGLRRIFLVSPEIHIKSGPRLLSIVWERGPRGILTLHMRSFPKR